MQCLFSWSSLVTISYWLCLLLPLSSAWVWKEGSLFNRAKDASFKWGCVYCKQRCIEYTQWVGRVVKSTALWQEELLVQNLPKVLWSSSSFLEAVEVLGRSIEGTFIIRNWGCTLALALSCLYWKCMCVLSGTNATQSHQLDFGDCSHLSCFPPGAVHYKDWTSVDSHVPFTKWVVNTGRCFNLLFDV